MDITSSARKMSCLDSDVSGIAPPVLVDERDKTPSHSPPKISVFGHDGFRKNTWKNHGANNPPHRRMAEKIGGTGVVAIHRIDPPPKNLTWEELTQCPVWLDEVPGLLSPMAAKHTPLRNVKRGDTLVILIYGLMNPGAEIDGYKCQGANEIVPKTLDYNSVELTSLTTASAIERCKVKAIFFLLLALQVSSVAATRKFCRSPKFSTILAKKKPLRFFLIFISRGFPCSGPLRATFWTGAWLVSFWTFWLGNVLLATAACNFWFLLWPHDSAPIAFSTHPTHESLEKHCISRLLQHLARVNHLSSDFRAIASSFFWLYFISLLFICFSTLHIVGSLLFKLPSIIHKFMKNVYIYIFYCIFFIKYIL